MPKYKDLFCSVYLIYLFHLSKVSQWPWGVDISHDIQLGKLCNVSRSLGQSHFSRLVFCEAL